MYDVKTKNQLELNFSKYSELYDIVIQPDNFWRQLNDMVDFSFVYEELKDKYSSTMGRTCEDVIRMFKYFLGYDPEETKLINPSLLTVFRRERLKDEEENNG